MANIHQEETFSAPAAALFRALVDPSELSKVTGAPGQGASSEGGAFTAFGGHVSGRHVELVEGKRVVQAWRAKTWPEGVWSLARFELVPEGADGKATRIVFDHDAFPEEMKEHLAAGWKANYWEPLRRHFTR
jgi:activator of HSP90 ATPase